jgi:uncharacterized protein
MPHRTLIALAAVAALLLGSALAQTPPRPVMSASSQVAGSLYVTYVAAWIDIVQSAFDGLTIAQEPGGSSQNIILVHTGETDFGITASSQAYIGRWGLGWADGVEHDRFAALHPAYPTYMTVVTLPGSGIDSFADLDGRQLGVGVPGGGSEVIARELSEHFGVTPSRFVNASWEDTGGLLRDGLIDAVLYIAGHPAGFLQELSIGRDLVFVPLGEENITSFLDAYPYYARVVLDQATYDDLGTDLVTLGQMNFMMGDIDLPDDFVTALLEAVYANVDRLAAAHPNFDQTTFENVGGIPTQFHPAAAAYYEAHGVTMRVAPRPE